MANFTKGWPSIDLIVSAMRMMFDIETNQTLKHAFVVQNLTDGSDSQTSQKVLLLQEICGTFQRGNNTLLIAVSCKRIMDFG